MSDLHSEGTGSNPVAFHQKAYIQYWGKLIDSLSSKNKPLFTLTFPDEKTALKAGVLMKRLGLKVYNAL